MDFQKVLDEVGYTEAMERLQAAKGMYKLVSETPIETFRPEVREQMKLDLVEMAKEIEKIEAELKDRFEKTVKYVDAMNDFELHRGDILERAGLVAEYFENDLKRPDDAEKIRKLMADEDTGPPSKP